MDNIYEKKVILKATEEYPEERGVCLSEKIDNGTIIVSVYPEYAIDGYDDLLREVGIDQVEFL